MGLFRKALLGTAVTLAAGLAVTPQANASLYLAVNGTQIAMSAGNTSVTTPPNSVFGNFNINNISGVGATPLTGSGLLYDLASLNVNSTGSGSIFIAFTETNLTSYGTLSGFFTGLLSNLTATRSVYYDAANTGAWATLLGSTTTGAGSFTGQTGTTPYSLTEVISITATGAGARLSTDDSVSVPEPASMALLGAGLVGVGVFRRRRAK